MVLSGPTQCRAWGCDRLVNCRYVSDEIKQLTADSRSRGCNWMVVRWTSSIQKAARRHTCARCTRRLRCNSDNRLDALVEISFRRFHRRRLQGAIARVDSETILGLVVT